MQLSPDQAQQPCTQRQDTGDKMTEAGHNGYSERLERIELGIFDVKTSLSKSVDKLTGAVESLNIRIIDEDKSVSGAINKLTHSLEQVTNNIENLSNQLEINMSWQEKAVPMRLVYMIIFTVILAFAGGAGLTYIKMLLHIPM